VSVLNRLAGGLGLFSTELRFGEAADIRAAAGELDELGFTGLWVPGGFGGPLFDSVRLLLESTRRTAVATGIANIWAHPADEVASTYASLTGEHPDRFLLGLGVSHPEFAPVMGVDNYGRPMATMRAYLDALDDAGVPATGRVLAALGPKMRELAVRRSAGIHSYFVPSAHTRVTREEAGADAVIAVEHAVVVEESPSIAREAARCYTSLYLGLPNYTRNLERFGYTAEDFADGGSDRLVDDLVAWGSLDQVSDRLGEHLRAGADHVCAQVITPGWDPRKLLAGDGVRQPLEQWRQLAKIAGSMEGRGQRGQG
jgi:probable F420-dependent oxidoreductase